LSHTFVGGPRYMNSFYQDAMSIVREYGKPDIFLTRTFNDKCPELQRELLPGQVASDRPDLCARIFQQQLKELEHQLYHLHVLGRVVARVRSNEFTVTFAHLSLTLLLKLKLEL